MHSRGRNSGRLGVAVLEFVVAMPVLFLTLLAGIQFASMLVVNSTVQAAAHEAARMATMDCEAEQIEARVNRFLDIHGIATGPGVQLTIRDAAITRFVAGDGSLVSTTTNPPPTSFVQAQLLISIDATPVPNLLETFCLDVSGKQIEICVNRFAEECDCP